MMYGEIIAVCYEIHTKHIYTLCGQKVELLSFKSCGTCSDHCALNGKVNRTQTTKRRPLAETGRGFL